MNLPQFLAVRCSRLFFLRTFQRSAICCDSQVKTHYEVLDLDPTASTKEIKKAYIELSMKYHPDKNPDDPDSASKFHEITQAYATLSDGKLRRIYDKGELGRMTSVADRERSSHKFEGSDFVDVSIFFQSKIYVRIAKWHDFNA